MPPEQFESARRVGLPGDVWSLGVTLYQFLCGQLPWQDESLYGLMSKIVQSPTPDLKEIREDLSPGICEIVGKMLQKDPTDRYSDAGELVEALQAHQVAAELSLGAVAPAKAESGLPDNPPAHETLKKIATRIASSVGESSEPTPNHVSEHDRTAGDDILSELLPDQIRERKEERSTPRPATDEARLTPAAVAPAPKSAALSWFLVLALLLGGGGAAAWYLLDYLPREQARRAEETRIKEELAGRRETAERARAAEADRNRREAEQRARQEAATQVASLLMAAETFRGDGLIAQAREKAAEALAVVPDHTQAKSMFAELQAEFAAEAGRKRSAAERERTQREAQAKATALLDTAQTYRQAGLLDKAREEAAAALEALPDHAGANILLAEIQAEIDAKQAATAKTAEYKKWADEGLKLRLAGKFRDAAAAYERAQTSAPAGDTRAAESAAGCLADHFKAQGIEAEGRGDFEQAVTLFAQALAKREDAETRAQFDAAKRQRAEKASRADAARKQQAYDDAMRQARSFASRKEWDQAATAYREALVAKPGDQAAEKLWAKADKYLEKLAKAERRAEDREEAARKQQAYDDAMRQARSFARSKDWEQAATAYEEALDIKPGDRTAKRLWTDANRRLEKLAKKTRQEEIARNQAAYYDAMRRARSFVQRKEWGPAAAAYQEALDAKPGDQTAQRRLTEANSSLGVRAKRIMRVRPPEPKQTGRNNFGLRLGFLLGLEYEHGFVNRNGGASNSIIVLLGGQWDDEQDETAFGFRHYFRANEQLHGGYLGVAYHSL